ncbi:aminotransferase class V-fold PLP-dependent enzyme [Enhydrobacter sp.]|jgi:alanine-glyoxylate transaminase/serine-glyoxylate transaminase/serine-pyruvate transaminase|uniref:pyridoxal-phosphate-dependent aminotransferase family protein n=1 Tax=Enhydrobacter sp. TaxID=1894999 RepID=UPI002628E5F8|nr:aminotransferase class V-fold PLP-dependent enzyme [Enhydrobacter sp.]WIM11956.1 MAG: Serine--glyoxylate aminotransferase [Enhydrobacter sp.]
MSVRAGREFLAIPGPTTVPDEVLGAMHRPAVDIYSGPLLALTDSLLADLARVFRTKGRTYIYIANGHGAWEASLTNVLSKGDRILVLESGRFAIGWGESARRMGVEVEILKGDMRRAVRPADVEARLKADKKGAIKAVLVAQIDTASGVVNDIAAIGEAMRAARHDALLMVDTVASLGCMPFEMDAWRVDVAMSGSQKGLMTPPGLSFVAANDRAREAHRRAGLRTPYWDWTDREGEQHYQKYAGTPPEHLLFGLRKAFDLLFEEGLENAFRRHRLLAEAVRRAVGVWAEGQAIGFNIIEAGERSDTVTTVLMNGGRDPEALRAYCQQKCGVTLGQGIGELSGKAFRIAHMGHVNAPMILGTLSVIEVALAALDVPHGKGGVQAAIDWLGEQVEP